MQDIQVKWGKQVAERGFTQIPNYLMQINKFVDDDNRLSPTEMIILLQLVATWWKKDELPFPSMSTLAEWANISERQVQRAVKSLEEKKFIIKDRKKVRGIVASNVYDLSPLVKILNDVAEVYVNKHPRGLKNNQNTAP
jgi:DNA-binding transcriptional regulator YhcF (GntR family)